MPVATRTRVGAVMVLWALLTLHAFAGETALDRYVTAADPTFSWSLESTLPGAGYTAYVIDLNSQTWRTTGEVDRTLWHHWLTIVVPDAVSHSEGLLVISGGSNGSAAPTSPDAELIAIAMVTQSVVINLPTVPNQPLTFTGDPQGPRSEDAIIAYSWSRYLTTADETWPAQLPMTKSAVRAMDATQAFLASPAGGSLTIDTFAVTGGSKRGWTAWLTAAVDSRVTAVVPVVIDLLNTKPSMAHHHAAYGFWAPALDDYKAAGITDLFDDPAIDPLLAIVDPYAYRARLTMPKFVIAATGDQFFLPDSWQFYWSDLVGAKHLRYVPNTDHSLAGSDALDSLAAWYLAHLSGTPLPDFSWSTVPAGTIQIQTITTPTAVKLWQVTNPTARDFRVMTIGATWTATTLTDQGGGTYVATVASPPSGWTAYVVELTFDSGGVVPFKFSTGVNVTPDILPFLPPTSAAHWVLF